jgi:hypothetical protein
MRTLIKFPRPYRSGGAGVQSIKGNRSEFRDAPAFRQDKIGKCIKPAIVKKEVIVDEERRVVAVVKDALSPSFQLRATPRLTP